MFVQMNKRFDPEPLPEMIALQREFKVFSAKHTLRQSFALLGIVPADATERQAGTAFWISSRLQVGSAERERGTIGWSRRFKKNLESARCRCRCSDLPRGDRRSW